MMTRALRAASLLLFVGCGGVELPKPASPLVPTLEEAWRAQPPPSAADSPAPPFPEIAERRLANGLSLSVATLPGASYFQLRLIARHHADRESARELAAAHRESRAADPIELMATVDSQTLMFELGGEAGELERALDIAAGVLGTPPWSSDLEWARQQREQGWPSAPTSDAVEVVDRLRERLLGISPAYEKPEPGATIVREEYQARLLNPMQVAVVVVGPARASDVLALLETRFAPIARPSARRKDEERTRPPPPQPRGGADVGSIVFIPAPRYVARVAFGVRVPAELNTSRIELALLAEMLGNGVSGFMDRALRQSLGLTRQVRVTIERTAHGDMLYGTLVIAPENLRTTLKALRAALIHMRTKLESLSFAAARERTATRLRDASLGIEPLAARLTSAFIEERPVAFEQERAQLEQLTEQQMRVLASRVLPRPLIVVMAESSQLAALQWDPAEVEYAPLEE